MTSAAQSTKNLDSKHIVLGPNTNTDGDQGSKTKTLKTKHSHNQGNKKASSLSIDIDHALVTKGGKTDNTATAADLATKSFLNS